MNNDLVMLKIEVLQKKELTQNECAKKISLQRSLRRNF